MINEKLDNGYCRLTSEFDGVQHKRTKQVYSEVVVKPYKVGEFTDYKKEGGNYEG